MKQFVEYIFIWWIQCLFVCLFVSIQKRTSGKKRCFGMLFVCDADDNNNDDDYNNIFTG